MKTQKDNFGSDQLKNQTSHKKNIQNKHIALFLDSILESRNANIVFFYGKDMLSNSITILVNPNKVQ